MSTTTNTTSSTRYHFSIWGRKPGWGFTTGWAFGSTIEEAAQDALAHANKWASDKFALPADIYLQNDDGVTTTVRIERPAA